jgi:helicase MOV-10
MTGDRILVQPHGGPVGKWFEGFVHVVRREEVGLCFHRSFSHSGQKYHVHFKLNRYPLRRQHQAMDTIFQNDRILFPTEQHLAGANRSSIMPLTQNFYNRDIATNVAQSQAVASILNLSSTSPPFCVFGPYVFSFVRRAVYLQDAHRPGTGKTVTIVEAIRQLLRKDKAIKILACAPSNSAADLIAERLAGGLNSDELFRFYAPSRQRDQTPASLEQYTQRTINGHFSVPNESRLMCFRVVVSTCVSASVFHGIGMARGHFNYIFVDEAGQATEPEVMISIKTMADNRTRIVLSGDHRQLGPIIRSDVARGLGLEISYLERLMQRAAYDEKRQHGIRCALYPCLVHTVTLIKAPKRCEACKELQIS